MKKIIALCVLAFVFLSVSAAQKNIVPNPSLEIGNNFEQWGSPQDSRPDKWHPGYRGTGDQSYFAYHWAGHSGQECVRVEISRNYTGDAKWYFEPVSVEPGKLYEIADWYVSSIPSQMYAAFGLTDGTVKITALRQTPAYPYGWTAYYDTVWAPENAANVSLFHAIAQAGWLVTDDYYMGLAPSDVVLMEKSKVAAAKTATERKAKIARDEEIRIMLESIAKTGLPKIDRDMLIVSGNS